MNLEDLCQPLQNLWKVIMIFKLVCNNIAENHSRTEHFAESFGYREIDGKIGPISPTYLPLQNELLSRDFYWAYCTFDIHPDDCYKWRLWPENVQLNFFIGVYDHQMKKFLGNLTYVWRIRENNERS